jgi:hypothetical protein
MTELYRAMISSMTKDMVVHREQAQNACLRQDFFPVMMEHLPPSPDDAVRRSLDLVDQADVYVLVLGLRYGEIPGGYEKSPGAGSGGRTGYPGAGAADQLAAPLH